MQNAYIYIPAEVEKTIPQLGATAEEENPTAWVKLFTPDASWTWYVIEYDGTDICYGYVIGPCPEFGTFSLAELGSVKGALGLPIERDLYFTPQPIKGLIN